MVAVIVDPVPPILLHNVIIVALAVFVWVLSRKRHFAVALAFVAGMGVSLLWRNVGLDFAIGWRDLLYEPVFEGDLFRHPFDLDPAVGFLATWLLPFALAHCAVALWKGQWDKRQARARALMVASGVTLVAGLCTWLLWPMGIHEAAHRGELRRVTAILRRRPEAVDERDSGG